MAFPRLSDWRPLCASHLWSLLSLAPCFGRLGFNHPRMLVRSRNVFFTREICYGRLLLCNPRFDCCDCGFNNRCGLRFGSANRRSCGKERRLIRCWLSSSQLFSQQRLSSFWFRHSEWWPSASARMDLIQHQNVRTVPACSRRILKFSTTTEISRLRIYLLWNSQRSVSRKLRRLEFLI